MNEQMIAWANSMSEFVDHNQALTDAALHNRLSRLAERLNARYYELCHEYQVALDADDPSRGRIAGEMDGLAKALRGISDLLTTALAAMTPSAD